MPPLRKPVPTKVLRALESGYTSGLGRAATEGAGGGIVTREVAPGDEITVPTDLNTEQAVVYRLQLLEANDELIAGTLHVHGEKLAEIKSDHAELKGHLATLVELGKKAEDRAQREEAAALEKEKAKIAAEAQVEAARINAAAAATTAAAAEKAAQVNLTTIKQTTETELAKARLTSREKILLAVVGVLAIIAGGVFAAGH